MSALERTREQAGRRALVAAGCMVIKIGFEGWPDRLVIYAPGKHFWIEWKRKGGSLTPAQEVRIPILRKAGEQVHICETEDDALRWLERHRAESKEDRP